MMMEIKSLIWDTGTAYDFFISLEVLHNPERFGLRGSWSAGVRSRLSPEQRRTLEQATHAIWIPLHWVYRLPAPKDGETLLRELAAIPAAERLPNLAFRQETPPELVEFLTSIRTRGRWDERDLEKLKAIYKQHDRKINQDALQDVLDAWRNPARFGEHYLEALQAYQEVFFAEEEKRIQPALEAAVSHGQALAQKLSAADLLIELSQGVRLAEDLITQKLVLAPSFWASPLIILQGLDDAVEIFVFGGRPPDVSLVPGETVPDTLLRSLKAMADPTRLRILRYLAEKPLTPTALANKLRLRAPTVVHHLNELRLAGLVYLSLEAPEKKSERLYAARSESIERVFEALQAFLVESESDPETDLED